MPARSRLAAHGVLVAVGAAALLVGGCGGSTSDAGRERRLVAALAASGAPAGTVWGARCRRGQEAGAAGARCDLAFAVDGSTTLAAALALRNRAYTAAHALAARWGVGGAATAQAAFPGEGGRLVEAQVECAVPGGQRVRETWDWIVIADPQTPAGAAAAAGRCRFVPWVDAAAGPAPIVYATSASGFGAA